MLTMPQHPELPTATVDVLSLYSDRPRSAVFPPRHSVMARSPKCCAHMFFSLFTVVSLVACLLALMTPAWLMQNTAADGTACNPSVLANNCGSLGPVVACTSKSDSPVGGTCKRWDQRELGDETAALALKGFNTSTLGDVFTAFPVVYWRAATGCYAAATIIIAFTALFSFWNWTCCTKSERAASGALFLSRKFCNSHVRGAGCAAAPRPSTLECFVSSNRSHLCSAAGSRHLLPLQNCLFSPRFSCTLVAWGSWMTPRWWLCATATCPVSRLNSQPLPPTLATARSVGVQELVSLGVDTHPSLPIPPSTP